MRVIKFLKQKQKLLNLPQIDLKDWLSPSLHDYWQDFINRAQRSSFSPRRIKKQAQKQAANSTKSTDTEIIAPLSGAAAELYELLQTKIGTETAVGDWLQVDQQLIDNFAAVTGDQQWIHTNPERAQSESPFKSTIAHGFLTLSLLPQLTGTTTATESEFPSARLVVNYGLESVRFPYPVKSGSNVRARTTIVSATPLKEGIELCKEIKVEIEGVRRPGCVVRSILRIYF